LINLKVEDKLVEGPQNKHHTSGLLASLHDALTAIRYLQLMQKRELLHFEYPYLFRQH